MPKQWYRMTQDGDTLRIGIGENILAAAQPVKPLLEAIEKAQKIEVFIETTGGGAAPALAVGKALAQRNATCTVISRCWSAGTLIAAGCHPIKMFPAATLYLHPSVVNFRGTIAQMKQVLVVNTVGDMECDEFLAARRGLPIETIRAWNSSDSYFSATQAIEAGLVDEIIQPAGQTGGSTTPAAGTAEPEMLEPKFSCHEREVLECLAGFLPFKPALPEEFYREINYEFARMILK